MKLKLKVVVSIKTTTFPYLYMKLKIYTCIYSKNEKCFGSVLYHKWCRKNHLLKSI